MVKNKMSRFFMVHCVYSRMPVNVHIYEGMRETEKRFAGHINIPHRPYGFLILTNQTYAVHEW